MTSAPPIKFNMQSELSGEKTFMNEAKRRFAIKGFKEDQIFPVYSLLVLARF